MNILDGLPEEILTRDAEDKLAWQHTEQSLNELVLHNLREAFRYARYLCASGIADDELLSVCYIALRGAARTFKTGQIRFFAYAKPHVRGQISREWKTKDVVRNSSKHESAGLIPAFFKARNARQDKQGSEGLPVNDLAAIDEACAPLEPDNTAPDFASINIRECSNIVDKIIRTRLRDQERMILELRFKSHFTLQQVGKLLNISRERVRQIQEHALIKIRGALGDKRGLLLQ